MLAYNVVARYAFSASSIALEELAWHFYSAIFLLGLSYALKAGAHVRVDLIFEGLSARTRAYIDLGGCLVFLLPLCAVVMVSGWHFTLDSWGFGERPDGVFALLQQALDTGIGEKSQDPGGLNNRWFIKGVIPLSFALLFLAWPMTGVAIFVVALLALLIGFPVAFTFAGIGILFVCLFAEPSQLAQIPYRIYSNMGDNGEGIVLMAIPLFIFMGLILQRTKLSEQLLESMGRLFGALSRWG